MNKMMVRKGPELIAEWSELLDFWTLLIVCYSKNHNISETGCLHPQVRGETRTLLGLLERSNLSHWTNQNPNYSECYTPLSEPFRI
jgi:hypothetical protein